MSGDTGTACAPAPLSSRHSSCRPIALVPTVASLNTPVSIQSFLQRPSAIELLHMFLPALTPSYSPYPKADQSPLPRPRRHLPWARGLHSLSASGSGSPVRIRVVLLLAGSLLACGLLREDSRHGYSSLHSVRRACSSVELKKPCTPGTPDRTELWEAGEPCLSVQLGLLLVFWSPGRKGKLFLAPPLEGGLWFLF